MYTALSCVKQIECQEGRFRPFGLMYLATYSNVGKEDLTGLSAKGVANSLRCGVML